MAEIQDLAHQDAEQVRERIRELWGCEVTLAYAAALVRFVDAMSRPEQRSPERETRESADDSGCPTC